MFRLLMVFFLFSSAVGFAQEVEEKILWQENNPLVWSLFKGDPNMNSPFQAETSSGISQAISVRHTNGVIDFDYEVESYFQPEYSWVKEGKQSDYLLAHEQLHFDISELHARKLRKALAEYTIGRNYKKDLQRINEKIQMESNRMQQKFDLESRHSQNKEAEMQWRSFVKSELAQLEQYAL